MRVRGVRHDSRAVEPGDLFVARRGEKVDGARFVRDAVERGATAVMAARGASTPRRSTVPVLFVDDPAAALGFAASAVYGHPSFSLEVVGITGTNGKTTTAHLVARRDRRGPGRDRSAASLGTVGHRFGAWSRARRAHDARGRRHRADDGARCARAARRTSAMEVSSHALALGRLRGVHFRVAALTNLTQDHLDFHGSMEAYAEAKARLFTELGPGAAVLNVDDAFGRDLAARVKAPLVRVSARIDADARPPRSRRATCASRPRGTRATVRTPTGDVILASRLVGAHNLENLLLALGIAHALELDLVRAADALSREPGAPGRLRALRRRGRRRHRARRLRAHPRRARARARRGPCSDARGASGASSAAAAIATPTKRAPMGEAVARRADVTVVTSDNPRTEQPDAIAAAGRRRERAPRASSRSSSSTAARRSTSPSVLRLAGTPS